jgi:RNA polymerase sigma-70 factor, ECF subfamily
MIRSCDGGYLLKRWLTPKVHNAHYVAANWLLGERDRGMIFLSPNLRARETGAESPARSSSERSQLQSSLTLLERAQAGDKAALESLIARYLPRLQRWASGRLPRWARDMADTQDLVQETLFQTFKRIERFESRGEGALLAYLRQGILNRIREELRRTKRRPQRSELDSAAEDDAQSPLEVAIGQEALQRYEQALARLRPEDRELVGARIELGYTNQEIADLLDKPTANAARMATERAIIRLAKEMGKTQA